LDSSTANGLQAPLTALSQNVAAWAAVAWLAAQAQSFASE
jgi:hypothetical protein